MTPRGIATIIVLFFVLVLVSIGVHSKEVARAGSPSRAEIVLFDDAADCKDGSKVALYQDPQTQVKGCWFEKLGKVFTVFDDGDTWAFERKLFFPAVRDM